MNRRHHEQDIEQHVMYHSFINTRAPLDPFNADRVRDINNGLAVAYVGRDSANVMGVAFSIE